MLQFFRTMQNQLQEIKQSEKDISMEEYIEQVAYQSYLKGGLLSKKINKINGNDIGMVITTVENEQTEMYCHFITFKNKKRKINFFTELYLCRLSIKRVLI